MMEKTLTDRKIQAFESLRMDVTRELGTVLDELLDTYITSSETSILSSEDIAQVIIDSMANAGFSKESILTKLDKKRAELVNSDE